MDNRSLNALLELLDEPILLRIHVASLRHRKDLDESVLGFIELFDACQGDCQQIKRQLQDTKRLILVPLKHRKKSNSSWTPTKYAAFFTLIGACVLLVFTYMNAQPIRLKHTFNDPGIPNYMATSAHVDLSEAMFYYKKRDFEKALTAINLLERSHPNNDTVQYYRALITFENGEHESAATLFESISKRHSEFADRALYFIGVHATEMNQLSRASRIFTILLRCDDEFVRAAAKAHLRQIQQDLH